MTCILLFFFSGFHKPVRKKYDFLDRSIIGSCVLFMPHVLKIVNTMYKEDENEETERKKRKK